MRVFYFLFVVFVLSVFSILAQQNEKLTNKNSLIGSIKVDSQTSELTPGPAASGKTEASTAARMQENRALGTFSTGDPNIDRYIEEACARYDVDPLLIYAQMFQESSFKRKATSHKGASGLMQLMPATAARFGVRNIYDPKQNIEAGVKYMRWLLDHFGGDLELALAGYNAGEGAVRKFGNRIPPYRETRNYVARITTHYEQMAAQIPTELPAARTGETMAGSF